MSGNLSKDCNPRLPPNRAEDSKLRSEKSQSRNETSTKATPGSSQTDHQPFAQDRNRTPSHKAGEPSRDTLLRGIGHWTGSPDQRSEKTADSSNSSEGFLSLGSGEQKTTTNSSSDSGRKQELSPMERFRAEKRRDEPFGHLDHLTGGFQRAPAE